MTYAYVHLSAHMEIPKLRGFKLLLYPAPIIWQKIAPKRAVCFSGFQSQKGFWNQVDSRSPEGLSLIDLLRTSRPGKLSPSQHAAVPSPFRVLLTFSVLISLSSHSNSQSNYIYTILHNSILYLHNFICLVEVI